MKASVYVEAPDSNNPFLPASGTAGRAKVRAFRRILAAIIGGALFSRLLARPRIIAGRARAYATVVMASSSDTVGATINGVALTATWATSDANSCSLVAAAIVASSNALIRDVVQACNLAATFTLSSVGVGESVTILGYTFTAKPTSTLQANEFNQSGNDTADATSLAAQINARPGLNEKVIATSAAGVVTVRQITGTTAAGTLSKSGAGITLSGQLAATAEILVTALRPGVMGNCVTIAASGTNVSIGGSATRLANGTEDKFTY